MSVLQESRQDILLTLSLLPYSNGIAMRQGCVINPYMIAYMARAPESEKVTELRKRFGQRVKELRLANSWTQKEVAAKLGVQLSIYTKYEQGRNTPGIDKLIELSEILGTTIDFLLTGNNSENKPLHTDRIIERLQALESFSNDDKETVIKIIDSLVIKQQVEGMVSNPYRASQRATG